MDKHQLAYALLQWHNKTSCLETLRRKIEKAVLERKESMTVGYVRASYKTDREYPYVEMEIVPDKIDQERWKAEHRKRSDADREGWLAEQDKRLDEDRE